jgi:hypothetical protein
MSVKNSWDLIKNRNYLKFRFPDFRDGNFPDRFFLFDILNTLEDACITKLIAQSKKARKDEEIK